VLEVEVIDIATGVLERADSVQGAPDRFMELQTEFALRALRALGVEPTTAEIEAIEASRGEQTLDVYQMFKDTLGEPGAASGGPPPVERAPTSWLGWQAAAHAGDPDPDDLAIRALLGQYGAALEAKSVEALAGLPVEMSEAQRVSLRRYFEIAADLRVRVFDVEVAVEGDEALATFTREDRFTDRRSGRQMRLEVRTSGILARQDGSWKIRGLREPS
jgi:hypothetical protein